MHTVAPLWLWATFVGIVVVALWVDFSVLKRQGPRETGFRQALNWSLVWVAVSLAFNGLLWWAFLQTSGDAAFATARALEFFTGYLLEKSLAVDNIFVFLMIFSYFAVPPAYQKRVLMIGVLGAIALRAVMILVGAWLLAQFHWVLYVFGAFLLLTGVKMWFAAGEEPSLDDNPALRLLKRVLPVSAHYDGERFWTQQNGVRMATPLLMVVALVALTDVVFAVDSIPAIFAITTDPFIVLTSNVFAVLGLRAMYFLLAAVAARFHLLSYGLALILVFIGTKMLIVDFVKIPIAVSLGVVLTILVGAMLLSLRGARTRAQPTRQ
ncbi:MAG: TerC family protein [Pseudomonadota bacterium]